MSTMSILVLVETLRLPVKYAIKEQQLVRKRNENETLKFQMITFDSSSGFSNAGILFARFLGLPFCLSDENNKKECLLLTCLHWVFQYATGLQMKDPLL